MPRWRVSVPGPIAWLWVSNALALYVAATMSVQVFGLSLGPLPLESWHVTLAPALYLLLGPILVGWRPLRIATVTVALCAVYAGLVLFAGFLAGLMLSPGARAGVAGSDSVMTGLAFVWAPLLVAPFRRILTVRPVAHAAVQPRKSPASAVTSPATHIDAPPLRPVVPRPASPVVDVPKVAPAPAPPAPVLVPPRPAPPPPPAAAPAAPEVSPPSRSPVAPPSLDELLRVTFPGIQLTRPAGAVPDTRGDDHRAPLVTDGQPRASIERGDAPSAAATTQLDAPAPPVDAGADVREVAQAPRPEPARLEPGSDGPSWRAEAQRIATGLAIGLGPLEIAVRPTDAGPLITLVTRGRSDAAAVATAVRVAPIIGRPWLRAAVEQVVLRSSDAVLALTPLRHLPGSPLLVTMLPSPAPLALLERLTLDGLAPRGAAPAASATVAGSEGESAALEAIAVRSDIADLTPMFSAFGPVVPHVQRERAGTRLFLLFLPPDQPPRAIAESLGLLDRALEGAPLGPVTSIVLRLAGQRVHARTVSVPSGPRVLLAGAGPVRRPGLASLEVDRALTRLASAELLRTSSP